MLGIVIPKEYRYIMRPGHVRTETIDVASSHGNTVICMRGGDVIDNRFEIVEFAGAGGMGTVYRALDTKLNRPVAIKVLSDELADAAARRRFQREAQMASSLNHPHILTVYDVGEIEGRQYIVAEFVDGGTLKDWALIDLPRKP